MKAFDRPRQALAKKQIASLNAKKAEQLDEIVEGVDDLTAGGTPIDPADLNDLVDQVLA